MTYRENSGPSIDDLNRTIADLEKKLEKKEKKGIFMKWLNEMAIASVLIFGVGLAAILSVRSCWAVEDERDQNKKVVFQAARDWVKRAEIQKSKHDIICYFGDNPVRCKVIHENEKTLSTRVYELTCRADTGNCYLIP